MEMYYVCVCSRGEGPAFSGPLLTHNVLTVRGFDRVRLKTPLPPAETQRPPLALPSRCVHCVFCLVSLSVEVSSAERSLNDVITTN